MIEDKIKADIDKLFSDLSDRLEDLVFETLEFQSKICKTYSVLNKSDKRGLLHVVKPSKDHTNPTQKGPGGNDCA